MRAGAGVLVGQRVPSRDLSWPLRVVDKGCCGGTFMSVSPHSLRNGVFFAPSTLASCNTLANQQANPQVLVRNAVARIARSVFAN